MADSRRRSSKHGKSWLSSVSVGLIGFIGGLVFSAVFYPPIERPRLEGASLLSVPPIAPKPLVEDQVTSAAGVVIAKEKNFFELGVAAGTDKVVGGSFLQQCLSDHITGCVRPNCTREECRPWGHWYHTLYQQRLGKYSLPDTEPFQFLEIGYVSPFRYVMLLRWGESVDHVGSRWA
jgi:hypothetical protein